MSADEQTIPRREVWKMFDRIAPRYDLLNRLLSFGRDVSWRNAMTARLPDRKGLHLLDLATGTGDQIISLLARSDRIQRAVGLDMAERMLEIGRRKMERKQLQDMVQMQVGDATAIPFPDASFDVVTISFGIRNVTDVQQALTEISRVLKPGGRALILEFSQPQAKWLRGLYLWYLRHVLPRIGSWISGDAYAYRYLNQTIESFPYGSAFCALMQRGGLVDTRAYPLTFGAASIYQGDKPASSGSDTKS